MHHSVIKVSQNYVMGTVLSMRPFFKTKTNTQDSSSKTRIFYQDQNQDLLRVLETKTISMRTTTLAFTSVGQHTKQLDKR